jgi:hypothetical protein
MLTTYSAMTSALAMTSVLRSTRKLARGIYVLALLAPATATAKPSVALTMPSQIDASAPIEYAYTASKVPRQAKLVIQRQMGTAGHFGTVATLAHRHAGSGTLPALALGQYRVRIAAIEHGKVIAQRPERVYVFGTVVFSVLFDTEVGTTTTPTNSFSYAFEAGFVTSATSVADVSAADSTCRSVHIDWVNSANGTTSLIQESRDPVSASAGRYEISSVEGVVTPGESWAISVAPTPPTSITTFWVNGSASCYSTST